METTASDASTHGEGAEPAALLLAYGTAVRIQDGGSEQGGVCLNQTRLDVFVRLEDGRIRSYPLRKVRRAEGPPPVAPLWTGDEVLLESAAGKLRGELAEVPGEEVVLRLRHGQDVRFPRAQVRALSLVHPARELTAGARFEVKSRSGNRYEGTVSTVLPDQRALVKLATGKTVELKLERLELETLLVLIPVSLDAPAEVPILSSALAAAPPAEVEPAAEPEQLRAALERERHSSKVLKRKLLQLLEERDSLAKDVKERERLLESEVWRGLAAQRDLNEARKKLEERDDGQREADEA